MVIYKFSKPSHVLGPSANTAIPELFRMITNEPEPEDFSNSYGVQVNAEAPLNALGAIGKDALPALLNILTNSQSPGRRVQAIDSITEIGTNTLSALPVLMHFVKDRHSSVAFDAVSSPLNNAGFSKNSA